MTDILEKNCIIKTTDTLLNYGEIDPDIHTIYGTITSSLPFTFTVLCEDTPRISIQYSIPQSQDLHRISVASQFTTELVSNFQLKLEGSDFDINVKLWKPYPISPIIPN